LYLLNQERAIVYSDNQLLDWEEDAVFFKEADFSSEYIILETVLHDRLLEGWSIVAVVDSTEFTSELIESSQLIIVLSFFKFILPALVIVYISKTFHVRLDSILSHMKNIEKHNFEEYPHVKSEDEIGQLARQINRMTRQIN